MNPNEANHALLHQLRNRLSRYAPCAQAADRAVFSTGCSELDGLFPDWGLRRGTILEWLSPGPGSGATFLALSAVRHVQANGALVLCDGEAALAPLALRAIGTRLRDVVIVRAKDADHHRWAIDQSLRSPAVALVWARLARLDDKTARRFQLAAESSGAIGVIIRPWEALGKPTWAATQLAVTPLAGQPRRTWRIECTRARGPTRVATVEVEWDETTATLRHVQACHDTDTLPLSARLARSTRAS